MNPVFIGYSYLLLAIIFEVLGTSFLVKSEQFTRLVPTLMTAILYICSFYFLTLTLKTIPLGIAYAIWGGVGIVLVALIGAVVFKQSIDIAAIIGITLIISGVVVINVFSNTVGH
ncbi:multidrug efflux SMR transporter [Psychrobacter sp. F1192]|uniref:Multidrug efflux SMR transporter n=1 Tax=Psychrobacter coccoides TaxID=2818440 RepID=A0ABS3NQ10_9GAMM|nr:multidrug efflux SMR transporter [Psychrobacter coccoides]MBO1531485.1 multidrug efflux SMR transporter [Psychrobacter coccoides]